MTQRAAVISLLIALVAGAACWLAMRKPPSAAPTTPVGWLATLDPRNVKSISIALPDGGIITVQQADLPDLWLLTLPGRGASEARTWPASSSHVRGAVRLIADLAMAAPQEGSPPPPETATTVTLDMADGQQHRLTLSGSELGGRTVVHVGQPSGTALTADARLADGALARMFTHDGLLNWRSPAPLGGAGGDVSRVRLEAAGRWISLRRNQGRWSVQEPIVSPADPQSCGQLVALLSGLQLKRFIEDASPQDPALGLNAPIALALTEFDVRVARGGDVERRTLIQEVRLGGPADASDTSLFASAVAHWHNPQTNENTLAWGPVVGVIARKDVDPIASRSEAYIALQAVQIPVADIVALTLSPADTLGPAELDTKESSRAVRFSRTIEGWRVQTASGNTRALADSATSQVQSLLKSVCDRPADAVSLERPGVAEPLARIDLGASDQPPAASIWLAVTTHKSQPAMLIQTGPVFRTYGGTEALTLLQWLRDELPPEG